MSTTAIGGHVGGVYSPDGTESQSFRQEAHGSLVVQQAGGKYKEATKRGTCYGAVAPVAGATPQTALGTTADFSIGNPAGSGKRIIVNKLGCAYRSGTLGVGMHIVTSGDPSDAAPSAGTAVTPRNRDVGAANTSIANCLIGGTITTSAAKMIGILGSHPVSAVTATEFPKMPMEKDYDGEIVIEPGGSINVTMIGANGSSDLFIYYASWEEETIAA